MTCVALVARGPITPSPDLAAYPVKTEVCLWARAPLVPGSDLVAYPDGPIAITVVEIGAPITGSLNVTLDPLTSSGTGSLEITGALAKTLDDLTSVGAGSLEITGSLNLTLDPLTSVSNGSLEITGSSSKTLDDVTLVATGTMPYPTITGSSAITLADTTLVAAGTLSTPGVGMDIGSVSVDAAGVVSGTGLAREIYDALLTQYAPAFPNPASPPTGVTISSSAWSTVATAGILSQKQSLARRATAYASAIVLHVQTNALADLGTGAIS